MTNGGDGLPRCRGALLSFIGLWSASDMQRYCYHAALRAKCVLS